MRLRKNLKSLKNAIDLYYLALFPLNWANIFIACAIEIIVCMNLQCCIFDPLLGWCFGHKAHGKKHIRAPFICCYHPLPKNIFQIVQYYSKCFQARGCPNSIDHRRGFWIWFFGNVWHKEVLCAFSRISSCRDWESTNVKCWFIRSTKISIRNTLTYFGIIKF